MSKIDEQMTNPIQALSLIKKKILEHKRGSLSLYSVLVYERAALKIGVKQSELDNLWESTKNV